ncbi:COPI associated protein [Histomonas meleagridis]|uniref:COPI associated protein n=1 Tax=Histomonas meleagridis TaxID=135588 RepID=UPI003559C66F|nr:COPI associated protein [Histomonas meleagridis]KAH0796938.1 COPI associated protein [Histomonas meleagridis]
MGFKCTIQFAFQVIALVAAVFGIVAGFVTMFTGGDQGFILFVRGVYTIIFALALGCIEVYVFKFFGYFGFLLKLWGKGLMYLFMGALLFATSGFGLACAIIYWACAVIYGILGIFFPVSAPPLLQGGFRGSEPDVHVSSSEIYEKQ